MGKFAKDMDAFDWNEVSVWDRVRSLAPSCDPVPGRLFRQPVPGPVVAPTPDAAKNLRADEPPQLLSYGEASIDTGPYELTHQIAPVSRDDLWLSLAPADASDDTGYDASPDSQIIADEDSPVTRSVDLLRSRLLPVLKKNNWTRVAVVSPEPGSGSTFLACNLAARLSRIGALRTVLMDLNLRDPQVAATFGLRAGVSARDGICALLAGELAMTRGMTRVGNNLALAIADTPAASSIETLSDPRTRDMLEHVETTLRPDITLFDMPPMLRYPDMTAFLPCVDAVLLVADVTRTSAAQIAECESAIAGQAHLLGVVLNKARSKTRKSWFRR